VVALVVGLLVVTSTKPEPSSTCTWLNQ